MLKKLGDRLFLVGVAHVLPKSMKQVRDAILREKPEVVAVELCPTRYLVLTQRVRRPSPFETIRTGGIRLSVLCGILYLLQSKFAHQTGMPAGEEMLTAIRYAKDAGARVELIDRDIGVTLQRLIDSMPLREKVRLSAELLLGLLPFWGKRVELERLTEEEVVKYLLHDLKRASPTVYRVLIEERDVYMASKIAILLSTGKKVTCIVGAGHVPGICERLSRIPGGWGAKFEYGAG